MASMILCPECPKTFRTNSGLNWHLSNPNGPHAGMSQGAIEGAVKKASQGGSPQATVQQSDTATEALEQVADLENRVAELEGTVAELEAVEKRHQEEVLSRITSLDSTITKSAQEIQRVIKGLETKQTNNKAEVRQLTKFAEQTRAGTKQMATELKELEGYVQFEIEKVYDDEDWKQKKDLTLLTGYVRKPNKERV